MENKARFLPLFNENLKLANLNNLITIRGQVLWVLLLRYPSDSQTGVHIWPENMELRQSSGVEISISHCGATMLISGEKWKHVFYIKTSMKLYGYNKHFAWFLKIEHNTSKKFALDYTVSLRLTQTLSMLTLLSS